VEDARKLHREIAKPGEVARGVARDSAATDAAVWKAFTLDSLQCRQTVNEALLGTFELRKKIGKLFLPRLGREPS
jgi:hypothetical protein